MILKLTTPILDAKGVDVKEHRVKTDPSDDSKTITTRETVILRDLCIGALLSVTNEDRGLSPKKKNQRFLLSMKLSGVDEVDITLEEAVLLKDCIGKLYGPLYVGRAYEIIENKQKSKEDK